MTECYDGVMALADGPDSGPCVWIAMDNAYPNGSVFMGDSLTPEAARRFAREVYDAAATAECLFHGMDSLSPAAWLVPLDASDMEIILDALESRNMSVGDGARADAIGDLLLGELSLMSMELEQQGEEHM